MRSKLAVAARSLGVSPLQVLTELAAMNQPWQDCWPELDDGFVDTIRERRRVRMGLSPALPRTLAPPPPAGEPEALPVSDEAAAILDKLMRKSYGLKSVRVSTLVHKWVHGASEDGIKELVKRGNLSWSDPGRSVVNLEASRLADTEHIVETYRRLQGG